MVEYWPFAIVVASGLVGWGELRTKVNTVRYDIDRKADKDVMLQIEKRLDRIEGKLDRLRGVV